MIVETPYSDAATSNKSKSDDESDNGASSSKVHDELLPQFSESVEPGHQAVDFSNLENGMLIRTSGDGVNPEESAPPSYQPYEAEFFEDKSRNVISHDPHLNEDGEALYRFLLTQSARPPIVTINIQGSHQETRTRLVSDHNHNHGHSHHGHSHHGHSHRGRRNKHVRTEQHTETVIDFSFAIYLPTNMDGPFHFSVPDAEPAYRGEMRKCVDAYIEGQRSSMRSNARTIKRAKKWDEHRKLSGIPPWIGVPSESLWQPGDVPIVPTITGGSHMIEETPGVLLRSSRTLREWADEYCASPKLLKEFVYAKVPYGWNLSALQGAVTQLIHSTQYRGDLKITFSKSNTHIFIRPSNQLSRALSSTWLYVLSWIFLIYPFIWLFKRFHAQGGGRWEVCGGAYAFKRYIHMQDSLPGQNINSYLAQNTHRARDSGGVDRFVQTSEGVSRLVGMKERDWYEKWESTIRECVLNRVKNPRGQAMEFTSEQHRQDIADRLDVL